MLGRVDGDVAHDLPMLYSKPEATAAPRPKVAKGRKSKVPGARRRLNEDALQAYIRRRLIDLLPACIPGVEITIYREPQGKFRRRFDLLVTAPTLERGMATVVIEIKWSDNGETGSGLVDQLADRYLTDHGRTYGIYLVGWMGEWKSPRGKSRDLAALRRHLDEQAAGIDGGSGRSTVTIRPIVLVLTWQNSPEPEDDP